MVLHRMTGVPAQLQAETVLDRMTSSDVLEKAKYFLLTCRTTGLSPHSIRDYASKLYLFLRFLEEQKVTETDTITPLHIRLYLEFKRETCNSISVHCYYRTIRRFFNFLIEEELLEKNPMAKIRSPKMERKIVRPLSTQEVQTLIMLCDQKTFVGSRNRALLLLFYDTGLRLREMTEVQLADIDQRNCIKVMGKGARERYVRFGTVAQQAIARYMMMRKVKGYLLPCLWVSEEGQELTHHGVAIVFKGLKQRAGFTFKCSPHVMRHSFGTQALLNGASEREVQILLGHSSAVMTQHYTATINSEFAVKGHEGTAERPGFSPVDRMGLK